MSEGAGNLLLLMSDEHSRKALGCYGNDRALTPNIDRLAARGTLFENAYTPCPICVPARASLATGHYGHASGHWDNATPYIGEPQSWGHRLQRNGNRVVSIGKLHYRNAEDPTGFDFQELPMHLVNGIGDLLGCVREPLPVRWKTRDMAEKIGPGETSYTRYDRDITDAAVRWLEDRAAEPAQEKPWTCFVSLVAPHFPLIAPEDFYALYAESGRMPNKPIPDRNHPWMAALRKCFVYDNFTDEKTRIALASYYGLVSFLDANLGRILDTLDETGLAANTRVVYVSDHGDNMGERGLWGKSNLLEEAAGIPTIVAGPGIPEGRRLSTPVNLTDIYPTVIETAGLAPDASRPGSSLAALANAPDEPERAVFSEYHAAGAVTGAFMIRKGRWKLIHYAGMAPQLFDLADDPDETRDLGESPAHADIRADLQAELRAVCDPDEVDRRAKRDQAAILERHGGRDAVVERGGFGATPAPGEKAAFVKGDN